MADYLVSVRDSMGVTAQQLVSVPFRPLTSVPDFVEDFSAYASTANMLSDPRRIYSEDFDFYNNSSIGGANKGGAGTIELDKTDGYGGLGQSMKYTWFSYGSPGAGGQLRRLLEWPTAQTDIWSEVAFKFSPNFKTDYGFSGGASYKWLFFAGPNQGHAWHLELVGSGGGLLQGYEDMSGGRSEKPPPSGPFNLSNLATGQWRVLRTHIRRNPALFDCRIDGTPVRSPLTNWSSSATIWGLVIGQNINMRPVNNVQTLKYGYVKVWYGNNNPGWGW